jgi:hypothetical protein
MREWYPGQKLVSKGEKTPFMASQKGHINIPYSKNKTAKHPSPFLSSAPSTTRNMNSTISGEAANAYPPPVCDVSFEIPYRFRGQWK